jgi:hypothetical protein
MKRRVQRYKGNAEQIVSDNGSAYISAEFDQFCKSLSIRHIRSSARHPATNGKAERFVRTFKSAMLAMESEPGTLQHKIDKFLLCYRNTPHSTTNRTPASMLYKYVVRTTFHAMQPSAARKVDAALDRQRVSHDAQAKERVFEPGDQVWVRQHIGQKRWRAATVLNQCGPLSYNVQLGESVQQRHIDQLLRNYTGRTTDITVEEEQLANAKRLDAADHSELASVPVPAPSHTTPMPLSSSEHSPVTLAAPISVETAPVVSSPIPVVQSKSSKRAAKPPVAPTRVSTREHKGERKSEPFMDEFSGKGSSKPPT